MCGKMAATKQKICLVSMSLTNATVKNAVKSYTMSKRYINTMLKAAVINIFYHRLNIDSKEFVPKTFNNISFQTPKPKSRNAYIRLFNGYMNACKDAIEKNYLREFHLYFIDAETENILEYYRFSFKYGDTDKPNPSQNEENLSNITCELLQTLQNLEEHPKLIGPSIEIRGELTYFEDTPDEYQPPGFEAMDESEAMLTKLNRDGNVVVLCGLHTGFHKLKCEAKGGIFLLNNGSETTMDIEENPLVINEEAEVALDRTRVVPDPAIFTEDYSEPINNEYTKSPSLIRTSKTSRKLNDTYLTDVSDVISINSTNDENTELFYCPCHLDRKCDSLWSPDIIECSRCSIKCHVACNGYLDRTFVGWSFVCARCEPTKNDDLSDPVRFKNRCTIRYLLACMYKLSRIPTEFERLFESRMLSLVKETAVLYTKNGDNVKPRKTALVELFNFVNKNPDPEKII